MQMIIPRNSAFRGADCNTIKRYILTVEDVDEEIILQRKRHSVLIQFFQDIDKGGQALPAVCLVGTKDA